jgi:hypothetical protein
MDHSRVLSTFLLTKALLLVATACGDEDPAGADPTGGKRGSSGGKAGTTGRAGTGNAGGISDAGGGTGAGGSNGIGGNDGTGGSNGIGGSNGTNGASGSSGAAGNVGMGGAVGSGGSSNTPDGGSGAGPNVSFAAHRATGTGVHPAPLYVHFDATATTSAISSDKPFFDLLYQWDFGDSNAGNWSTSGLPKNKASGGVAGHVFERPGTYSVRLTVTDRNGRTSTVTHAITVDDPEAVWGKKTACISSTGNFSGCPAGATHTTSSAFGSALTSALNAGSRRILLRRGDTFTGGAYSGPRDAPMVHVGAFGDAAARPRIDLTSGGGPEAALGSALRIGASRIWIFRIRALPIWPASARWRA